MIQFTERGVEVAGSEKELAAARASFASCQLCHLPGLLSPRLADMVRRGILADGFEEPKFGAAGSPDAVYRGAYQSGKVGEDLRPGDTAQTIRARTNDPRLLDFVAQITGSPPLERCVGRVFRLLPMGEDLPWHTDAEGGRLADLIIDLSIEKHEGGCFQMREKGSGEIFNEVDDMAFGDGLLIRISPEVEHHYKAITGTIPKVTFSGWFVPKSLPSA